MPLIEEVTRENVLTMIQTVVELAAESRRVGWQAIMDAERGSPQVAAARVLAMAVCCAANIPMHVVGRAFGRKWQTVDSARQSQTARCLADQAEADEFIRILYRIFQPGAKAS